MNQVDLFREILSTYRKHGWSLRRVLARAEMQAEMAAQLAARGESVDIREAEVEAMWFARPSHEGREAWELRLVAEAPYALFETFEADEAEEDREEVRREMEARMREHIARV